MPTRTNLARLSLLAILFAVPTALHAQGNVGCVSATSPHALAYRDGYGTRVSLTGPAAVTARTRLALPNIPNAQVTIVNDTTTCRKASAAYDSVFNVPAPNEAPLVLQLGSQYIVVKGLGRRGGRANVLFDQTFTVAQRKIWN